MVWEVFVGTGWRAAAVLAAMIAAAPGRAADFTKGTLDPAPSLVTASHSTVAPVSPTAERFNETPAHIEEADAKDASIAAALSINDMFSVAEGSARPSMLGVEAELAQAEDGARLSGEVSGPLAIANGLSLPTARETMAPPADLMPAAAAAVPIALNAVGD